MLRAKLALAEQQGRVEATTAAIHAERQVLKAAVKAAADSVPDVSAEAPPPPPPPPPPAARPEPTARLEAPSSHEAAADHEAVEAPLPRLSLIHI